MRLHTTTAMMLSLVISGSMVVTAASESDQLMPEPAVIVGSTGATDCYHADPGSLSVEPGGILRERGVVLECVFESDDPRYTGDFTVTWNEDCYLTTVGTAHCIYFGADAHESAEGGWDCTWTGTPDPTGKDYMLALTVCDGTGGYQGLAYVGHRAMLIGGDDVSDLIDHTEHRGIIYQGEPPPVQAP